MSQLIVKGHDGARFKLNVTQFRSPMSAAINSVQTRTMAHHFPIRAGQPDIQFTVQFRSISDHHEFRDFARKHQRNALTDNYRSSATSNGQIVLSWPERDINNWTGYIVTMPGRDVRFEYAPRMTFGIALVESLMSQRSFNFSLGSSAMSIVGQVISAYQPDGEDVDAMIPPPVDPSSLIGQAIDTTTGALNSIVYNVGTNRR